MEAIVKILCEECKEEFEIRQDMLKEKYLGGMITETYFKCPECDKKYLVCINTLKARELMAGIRKHTVLGNYKKVNELKKELKIEMDKSNGKST